MTESNTDNALKLHEIDLLREVLQNQAPNLLQALFPKAEANALSEGDRRRLCELIGAEFVESGLDERSEPTARGLRLEELLDLVNRPILNSDG